ncbi:glycosyltransferase [Methylomonas koyamae]|uniref:glycosyltransferase n=1 Tax=Methylomonas koyamae TaxID=702114 RepID=UPI002873A85E|nr:glycosyltransferase [Methylomonas koyamae]WNB77256.1 glycosyltransferase [Methylomonas koyamae]
MISTKKRVVFFAETVTLAHIARCMVVAKALQDSGKYIVALAADKRFDGIIDDSTIIRFQLSSISCEQFAAQLSKGNAIYNSDTLVNYVNDDLAVIDHFKPDLIIGDFRLSLSISSRLANIPYATITNAYWSPYAKVDYPIPEIPLTEFFGVSVAQKLFDLARPLVFWLHSLALNRACKKFRLPPVASDMREVYTHADYTLYADIESLFSMKPLPKNHLFIGPVLWSADVEVPAWWATLPENKPIIFVTLGSSGDTRLLPMILETLSKLAVTVICATAQKSSLKSDYPNVFVADFLPAEVAVKKADLVICNGGSPMVYQCLVENKAVIGIPSNLDQYLMTAVLIKANRGYLIRAGQASPTSIAQAVNEALSHKPLPLTVKPSLALEKIISLIDAI